MSNANPRRAPVKPWLRRIFTWILAVCAIAFVVSQVPVRDRCLDSAAAGSTKVAVTKKNDVCILHIASGDVSIPRAECDKLRCEPGLRSTFGHVRILPIVGLFALYIAGTVAWALRWRLLLRLANVPVSLAQVWRVSTQAQAGGVLLPGGVMGDALRVGSIASKGGDLTIVIASVLLDRAIGLVTIAGVAVTMALVFGAGKTHGATAILGAIPIGFLVSILVLRTPLIQRAEWLQSGRIGKHTKPIVAYFGHPRAPRVILTGLLVSILVSGIQFATIRGFVFALGATPTAEKWVYVGSAIALIVAALPMLPGGWGTTDAAYILFLGEAGLSATTALAVCLLYRLFWYLYAVLGAVLYLTSGAQKRSSEAAPFPPTQKANDES